MRDKYLYIYESDSISWNYMDDYEVPGCKYPCTDHEIELLKTYDRIYDESQRLIQEIKERGSIDEYE